MNGKSGKYEIAISRNFFSSLLGLIVLFKQPNNEQLNTKCRDDDWTTSTVDMHKDFGCIFTKAYSIWRSTKPDNFLISMEPRLRKTAFSFTFIVLDWNVASSCWIHEQRNRLRENAVQGQNVYIPCDLHCKLPAVFLSFFFVFTHCYINQYYNVSLCFTKFQSTVYRCQADLRSITFFSYRAYEYGS